MSDASGTPQPRTRAELFERLRTARADLDTLLDSLTDEQFTRFRDAGDWSVKDHVVNLALWERSIINLLRGVPRSAALGVDEETYLELDEHGLNAIMVAEWRERPTREVLALYRETHQETLHLLENLSWEELQQPYAHFLPDEPGEPNFRPVLDWVLSNTADHYDQHRPWIAAIASQSQSATEPPR